MNTRILPVACLLAASAQRLRPPPAPTPGSYVVVGCSDLAGSAARSTDGWYLAAGGYPSRDECGVRARLQSRGAGGWRTRATLRTDGLGRFSASGQRRRAPVSASSCRRSAATPSRAGVGRP